MRAVIIEDEIRNQLMLKQLVEENCPNVEILGYAETVEEGKDLIESHQPDLVFLDIQLKDGTGFDLLLALGNNAPYVIFTTAYDQYALKAFKFSAIDYLLKPIIPDELIQAIKKVESESIQSQKVSIKNLLNNLKEGNNEPLLTISGVSKVEFVKVGEILRIEASGAYSMIILSNGESHTVSKVIKEYQELLSDHNFFRIHQTHLINIRKVKRYIKGDHVVVMEDGKELPVARNRKDEFLKTIGRIVLG